MCARPSLLYSRNYVNPGSNKNNSCISDYFLLKHRLIFTYSLEEFLAPVGGARRPLKPLLAGQEMMSLWASPRALSSGGF
jgi:hypothetical protein